MAGRTADSDPRSLGRSPASWWRATRLGKLIRPCAVRLLFTQIASPKTERRRMKRRKVSRQRYDCGSPVPGSRASRYAGGQSCPPGRVAEEARAGGAELLVAPSWRWCSSAATHAPSVESPDLQGGRRSIIKDLARNVTDLRCPLCPGRPSQPFVLPTSGLRHWRWCRRRLSQGRTAPAISTSAPSTEVSLLESFSHPPPSLLTPRWIGRIDRLLAEHEPLVISSDVSCSAHEDATATRPRNGPSTRPPRSPFPFSFSSKANPPSRSIGVVVRSPATGTTRAMTSASGWMPSMRPGTPDRAECVARRAFVRADGLTPSW